MGKFAQHTTVSPERSRAEIEGILRRYGADQFMSGWESGRAVIAFRAHGRFVRFILRFPPRDDKRFTLRTVRGRPQKATPEQAAAEYEQEVKQRWRALALTIKAKLESVATGIEVFDCAFMGQLVMPSGRTLEEDLLPQIEAAYRTGEMPRLLPNLPPVSAEEPTPTPPAPRGEPAKEVPGER